MKAKKLLALTLALILALSCMSITAFAAATAFEKDFLLNIPHLTVGTTAEQLKSGITFADATIGNDIELIDAVFYNSAQDSKGTVAAPEHDRIFITFQVKNTTDYNNFGGKTLQGLPFKSYNAEVTFKDGNTDLTNVGTIIGNSFDTTTHEVGNSGNGDNIYCQVRCAVTVYDGTAILDLEDSDTYPDTKSGIEQTYTATVYEPKTDKTKVQVSWKVPDIAATVTQNKIWNTDTLTWDNDGAATAKASPVTAEFDFVNYSSGKVVARVEFAVNKDDGFTDVPPTFTDSDETAGEGDGAIILDTKATDKNNDNTGNIMVYIEPVDDEFNEKNGTGTYGTYTITIADNFKIEVVDGDGFANADTGNVNSIGVDETVTLKFTRKGSEGSFKDTDDCYIVEVYNSKNYKVNYLDESGNDISGTANNGISAEVKISEPVGNVKIIIHKKSCLAEGTLISMADGTYKKVETIVAGDMVKTFDHEKGEFSSAPVYLNFTYPEKLTPFTLYFDGNLSLTLTCGHSLLEKTSRKYVSVNMGNVEDNIGKFFFGEDGKWHELLGYEIGTEPCNWYNLYTAYDINSFANGLLQVPSDVDCYLNFYELDENLKADPVKLANDIDEYGLFDYEQIKGKYDIDEELFNMTNGKYNYIIIGKGLATYEYFEWINEDK